MNPIETRGQMNRDISVEMKQVIIASVAADLTVNDLNDDYQLIGNLLDSMAVTNLILALEEHFGFTFEDEELSAEAFETIGSLTELLQKKVSA
jgi:acyl carrier protein